MVFETNISNKVRDEVITKQMKSCTCWLPSLEGRDG
ncbi:MAG: hypothetical protein JWN04_2402 [Myxococcaceae bacterium]|nr:hypothetical protein [Myxococcaceae bacterium]